MTADRTELGREVEGALEEVRALVRGLVALEDGDDRKDPWMTWSGE